MAWRGRLGSPVVGAQSPVVGAQSLVVGAQSLVVGAQGPVVGAGRGSLSFSLSLSFSGTQTTKNPEKMIS